MLGSIVKFFLFFSLEQHRKILEMEATQEEGEEQTTLSQRTGASNAPVAMVGQSNRRDVETGR